MPLTSASPSFGICLTTGSFDGRETLSAGWLARIRNLAGCCGLAATAVLIRSSVSVGLGHAACRVIRFCRPSNPGNSSPPRTRFGVSQPTDPETFPAISGRSLAVLLCCITGRDFMKLTLHIQSVCQAGLCSTTVGTMVSGQCIPQLLAIVAHSFSTQPTVCDGKSLFARESLAFPRHQRINNSSSRLLRNPLVIRLSTDTINVALS